MGLPAYSVDKNHLVRGDICTTTFYACGKETVSLANSGSDVVKKVKDTTSGSGTVYVMDESTMEALFTIDSSESDAYSGCKANKYELVQ